MYGVAGVCGVKYRLLNDEKANTNMYEGRNPSSDMRDHQQRQQADAQALSEEMRARRRGKGRGAIRLRYRKSSLAPRHDRVFLRPLKGKSR
jgi:hypothetical protein